MKLAKERNILIGLAGISAAVIFLFTWFTASMYDPAWVFGTNYLSDLGVSDYQTAAELFNFGCIISGILFTVFGLGILISPKKGLAGIDAGLFAVFGGILISLVGIITKDMEWHGLIAIGGIGLGLASLVCLAARDWKDRLRILSTITLVSVVAVPLSYMTFILSEAEIGSFAGIPAIETITVIVMLLLFLLQGMKYLYNGADAINKDGKRIAEKHAVAFGFTVILASTGFLIFWLFAMLSDPAWTFGEDALYMLGYSAVHEAHTYFVIACLTGVLLAAYGVGASMKRRGVARSVSGVFMILMGIALAGEGIALLAGADLTVAVEYPSVVFGAAALFCITVSDWQKKKMVTGAFYLIIVMCGLAAMVLYGYEMASALSILIFFAVLEVEGVRLMFM
ncbi:MAG: DUF998 domain-containing protein [Methanomassiliicoccaceae archaeon]|nr:DUF998 domain-containing protein [Methanomassiliicoccaceae archaeon]